MSDAPLWTDKANVLITGLGVVVTLVVGWITYALGRRQDRRRRPQFSIALTNYGFVAMSDPPGRAYWFDLAIGNLSEAENTVATLDLELTYRRSGEEHSARVPLAPAPEAPLAAPLRVPANDTVAGRARFPIPARYLDGTLLHGLAVRATDTHGRVFRTSAPLVVEALP